ncbi:MAG TPA: DUF6310 domain-containing protein [Archangium sp.]|uniref:DUF6310 domain-containing protein n=1 Tax=Archangium sp. TaxID=1872627 RepID=UPI002E36DC85|nr:DUF6310 domain-containing protein [Archangium sp.]HEX5748531.1 DUF6310 domain-containing protein [Archangium sp.]
MFYKHPSPAVGEGGGTQPMSWWRSSGQAMRAVRAVLAVVLWLQLACATSYPMGGTLTGTARSWRREGRARVTTEALREDLVVTHLRRAAKLPWTDGGRCVVEEAGQPWADLVERCYPALDHERVRFRDTTGRCSVASAGAGALGIGLCVLAAPELAVGAVVVVGVVVVGFAISEALEAYEKRGRPQVRPPPTQPMPEAPPVVETKPAPPELKKKRRPKSKPEGEDGPPGPTPEPTDRERERKCEAIPVPHKGGNKAHNTCADGYPPNRWPGMDAQVDGKNFDALQVGVRVLWEIKVEYFDDYSDFLKKMTVDKEMKELKVYRDIALACGYDFKVGVISEAHKAALLDVDATFDIVLTWCK